MLVERLLTTFFMIYNHSVYEENNSFLLKVFEKIKAEKSFENLIIYENCLGDAVLSSLELPVVLFNLNNECNLGRTNFNRKMLILYCLGYDFDGRKFEKFVNCLGRLRGLRIIFAWSAKETEDMTDVKLAELFTYCQKNFMPNVISIYTDIWRSKRFSSYVQFPVFDLISAQWNEKIFPNRFSNLQGKELRTLPDTSEPRTIQYTNENGLQVTGYIVRLVQSFAKKHNATLKYPYAFNKTNTPYWILYNLTINGELDIPMSVASPVKDSNPQLYSRVVEQATWFLMIPLSPPTPIYEIFLLIINSRLTAIMLTFWIGFSGILTFGYWFWTGQNSTSFPMRIIEFLLILTSIFRGFLGQSITLLQRSNLLLKIIYSLFFLSGIFFCTTYNAYLQTFLTSPPKPKEINTFDDLLNSKIKVLALPFELGSLHRVTGDEFWQKYEKIFSTNESNDYGARRRNLDTRTAFTVTSSLWPVLDEYQSRLARPRFHHPPEMYFTKALYLCIPQYEYSIYRESLNTLIVQLQESGLLNYWILNSYKDMILARHINLTREWIDSDPRGLGMNDFYWVWLTYFVGLSLGAIIFFGEYAIDIFKKKNSSFQNVQQD